MAQSIDITDLAGVVYSSGKVFDGLRTGRLDTENFLRSGNLDGINSRADLALLEDLRDVASLTIAHAGLPVDAAFVRQLNAQLTRSGALHPGQLRTSDQQIGVNTRYGRHDPVAVTDEGLQRLIDHATAADPVENALDLFIDIAKAQPFEDGNKRTALFAANSLLLGADIGKLLVIPIDEQEPALSDQFNDLLARAYVQNDQNDQNDQTTVKTLLRKRGLVGVFLSSGAGQREQSGSVVQPHPQVAQPRDTTGWAEELQAERERDRTQQSDPIVDPWEASSRPPVTP